MRHCLVLILLMLPTCDARADDPAGMLSRFAGVWRTSGESKPAKWTPESTKFTVQESTQSVLKGRFILGHEHSLPDGRKSLWLMTHDAQSNTYPFWMFDSTGLLGGEWELKWDAASSTARGRSTDTPPGWTSGGTNHFTDRETNVVDYWMKDEAGALLMDVHSEKKRQPEADSEAILAEWSKSEPSADRPVELEIFDVFVGTWDAVTVARPAEWTPTEVRITSVVTRRWILNKRFVLDNSVHADGQESLALFGYDPQAREYRTWWFNSEGHRNSAHGRWDSGSKTFSFETKLEQGRVSRSTIRLLTPDKHEWSIKVTDASAKVYYDSTITVTRRAPANVSSPKSVQKPANDLRTLEGNWRVIGLSWSSEESIRLPKSLGLNERGTEIQFDGNRLLSEGHLSATLANDLALPAQQNEIGFAGSRLMMLTLPDGKGFLCSYLIKDGKLQIAYPHTCSCRRGSGQVIDLERTNK